MATREKADWSAQRERLLKHRDEIVTLVKAGRSMTKIRVDVGMEDVPYSTFHHHAARFRDAGEISEDQEPVQGGQGDPIPSPSPVAETIPDPVPEPAPEPAAPPQPERVAVGKSDEGTPKKAPPRKRKLVTTGLKEPTNEEQGYDPAKWKKLDI